MTAAFRRPETDPGRFFLAFVAAILAYAAVMAAVAGSVSVFVPLLVVVLLVVLLRSRRRSRASWAFLYEHGLVRVDHRRRATATRWSDVVGADFEWRYLDSDGTHPWGAEITGYILRTATSGDVVLPRESWGTHDSSPQDDALPGLLPPGRDAGGPATVSSLPQALEQAVVGTLARRALARIRTEGHVDFGDVRLSQDAITVDGRPVAWAELTSCDIDGWWLELRGRFGRRTTRNVHLDQVEDAWVLVQAVVQRLLEQRR
jgi:hypothetical protein